MLTLAINRDDGALKRILCLGAHSDDIEIGCGGTILRLLEENPQLSVYWVVFGSQQTRSEEALASANALLSGISDRHVVVKGFKDSYFPFVGSDIKDFFESLKKDYSPDLIFTHYRHDLHQDHRLISDLTWNTFRNHLILEYEIPKYDGDLGSPNLFFCLDEQTCRRKVAHILSHFKTQHDRFWFTEETFLSLLRLRGVEARSSVGYAEGFYGRKLVV
jgi:LmbE family N-acetylglucosaminyl deacetylase